MMSIAVDPSDSTHLYAVLRDVFAGVLYESTDAGDNWHRVLFLGEDAFGNTQQGITFDPSNADIIYVGSWRSIDGGANWSRLTPLSQPIIAVDPANGQIIYSQSYGSGGYGAAIHKRSTDGGLSWTTITPEGNMFRSLAIDPASPNILYAGALGTSVMRSQDRGDSWVATSMTMVDPNPGGFANQIVVDPSDSSRIIYTDQWAGGWIYLSVDSGVSARPVHHLGGDWGAKLMADPYRPDCFYAFRPRQSDTGNEVQCLVSTDGGETWQVRSEYHLFLSRDVSGAAITPEGHLYAVDSVGVSFSTNGGAVSTCPRRKIRNGSIN